MQATYPASVQWCPPDGWYGELYNSCERRLHRQVAQFKSSYHIMFDKALVAAVLLNGAAAFPHIAELVAKQRLEEREFIAGWT